VFLLNSRLGLFTAALSGCYTLPERPFSRSYGAILPSSLTRVIPRTLGFSPRLPVSVCGTGTGFLARRFSWQCEIRDFATEISLGITAQPIREPDLPDSQPHCLHGHPLGRSPYPPASRHCSNGYAVVLEFPPVVRRLRLSASA
jgi:hypothetical protein